MRADAARNSRRILDAARRLVTAHGPAVGMDDIAREAGVAVGTLYRRYPTKADLVAAVVEDSTGASAEAAEAALAQVRDGADAGAVLAALFRGFADHYAGDRALKAAADELGRPFPLEPAQYPEGSPAHRAGRAAAALLAAAQDGGAVRRDLTLDDLAGLLAAAPADDVRRARYVEIVLAGLGLPLPGT